jgi:hypothetical protein
MSSERRSHARIPIRLPVHVAVDGNTATAALLLDVSRSGMFVRGVSLVEVGAAVSVEMTLRGVDLCTADGRVVRKTAVPGLEGFAVHFDSTNTNLDVFMADLEQLPRERWAEFLAAVMSPVIEVRSTRR